MFQQVWFVFLDGHQPLVLIILDLLEDSFFYEKKMEVIRSMHYGLNIGQGCRYGNIMGYPKAPKAWTVLHLGKS